MYRTVHHGRGVAAATAAELIFAPEVSDVQTEVTLLHEYCAEFDQRGVWPVPIEET